MNNPIQKGISMNISVALQLNVGEPAQIQGTVKKAFSATERTSPKDGSTFWTQGFIVADSTGEIQCSVAGNSSPGITLGENVTVSGKINQYSGRNGQVTELKGKLVARQQSQQAPQGTQQAHHAPSDKDGQIMRQNALGHATALVVAGKVGMDELFQYAVKFAAFSATGAVPGTRQQPPQQEESYGGDDDIPF
jgi:hypothetical protein